jgi:hypothetical protein
MYKPRLLATGLALFAAVACFSPAASAQENRTVSVRFEAGASGATYREMIRGRQSIDYIVRARAGQRMTVSLRTNNTSAYFNVLAPGAQEAMFIGSTSGSNFSEPLPSSGDYRVQVYLMRNAARRNETARFTLTLSVESGGEVPSVPGGDFADSLAGGPDFWRVSGLGRGDRLNIRTAPSPQARSVWGLSNGTIIRNLGCRMAAGGRWCRVGLTEDRAIDGWVNGQFLIESGPPRQPRR